MTPHTNAKIDRIEIYHKPSLAFLVTSWPKYACLLLVFALPTLSCSLTSSSPTLPTTEDAFGGTKCHAYRPPTEPDLMGWDSGSRANLVRLKGDGAVVVKYNAQGCNVELEVLSNCSAPAEYKFTPYSANDHKVMNTVEQLYSQLPVGATSLAAKLKNSRSLRTDYMMAGILSLKAGSTLGRNKLKGDCSKATHVVSAIYVGGFAMAAGSANEVQGALSIFGVGVGGGKSTSLEQVSSEGSAAACEQSQKNLQPNEGCSVPLRLGLTSIADSGAETTSDSEIPTENLGKMLKIAGGTFKMSTDSAGDRKKFRTVTVNPFEMDTSEVTVAAYKQCVDVGKCTKPQSGSLCNWMVRGRENHPINCVNWLQADAYCGWAKKRLPSDEEWEFAARGQDGRLYPWGDDVPDGQGCFSASPGARHSSTCEVGRFARGKSLVGAVDLVGNVSEWVSSAACPSGTSLVGGGSRCEVRGGSFVDTDVTRLRATSRLSELAGLQIETIGFRCASAPSKSASPGTSK